MLKRFKRNRVRRNAKTSEEEHWFQGLLDAAPDAMVVVDQDGNIVLVNTQTERLFGYQREEILGREWKCCSQTVSASSIASTERISLAQPHVRPMGVGLELFGLRKGGAEFPTTMTISPYTRRSPIPGP